MVTFVFCGYAIGGILAGVLGRAMIETYGWQSVFLAAAVPALFVPLFMKVLPEGMPLLLKENRIEELKNMV